MVMVVVVIAIIVFIVVIHGVITPCEIDTVKSTL